jgi:hypothetical protein
MSKSPFSWIGSSVNVRERKQDTFHVIFSYCYFQIPSSLSHICFDSILFFPSATSFPLIAPFFSTPCLVLRFWLFPLFFFPFLPFSFPLFYFLAYFINIFLCYFFPLHLCVCVSHPINFWMPDLMFMKICMHIVSPEPISTAYFEKYPIILFVSLLRNGFLNRF